MTDEKADEIIKLLKGIKDNTDQMVSYLDDIKGDSSNIQSTSNNVDDVIKRMEDILMAIESIS